MIPTNDQPDIEIRRVFLPNIAYNVSANPNSGELVENLLQKAKAFDVDKDHLGIAIVQAMNSSLGSWYYISPSGEKTQVIVDNRDYTDTKTDNITVVILNSTYVLLFVMHDDSALWNNLEAAEKAKIIFLPFDGTDNAPIGQHRISRPSEATSAYGKKSVMAIARRLGCDGRAGSKGKYDRCGDCGGDGLRCVGCDNVVFSGAVIGTSVFLVDFLVNRNCNRVNGIHCKTFTLYTSSSETVKHT